MRLFFGIDGFKTRKRDYISITKVQSPHGTFEIVVTQVGPEDKRTMSVLEHDKTFEQPINWTTTFFLGAFHVAP